MFDIITPSGLSLALIYLTIIWTLPWKGYALWKAAKKDHKAWFIILFLINTLAILEILYIFIFSEKHHKGILTKLGIKK